MGVRRLAMLLLGITLLCPSTLRAQDAQSLIRQSVQTELAADKSDRTLWRYRDDEQDKRTVSIVVETNAGSVTRLVERDGRPLSTVDADAEDRRIQDFVHDPAKLAKQRKDGASDGESARQLLEMLPVAFTWKVVKVTEDADTLAFAPKPDFKPANLQARVLSAMAGEVVVDRRQHRMKTLSGRLSYDVTIGYGLLGRMKEGGTFRVERREVKPGLWQIVETHVHIDGKALLFKQIGQQQDEFQSNFTQVPGGTTLEQAAAASKMLQ